MESEARSAAWHACCVPGGVFKEGPADVGVLTGLAALNVEGAAAWRLAIAGGCVAQVARQRTESIFVGTREDSRGAEGREEGGPGVGRQ